MKNLETKRKFSAHCERVKSVDIHPTEPWVLTCLYNGSVSIWDFNSKSTSPLKSFEITEQPIRTGKFVARKSMFVVGSDDFKIRAYNYNTSEKLKEIKDAHSDYIRCIEIHPSRPFFLSTSDDMTIKLWDWENGWICTQVFEGHAHYVMQVCFNPKDPNTFASSSLDRSVKIWGLGSTDPHFTLAGHEKGVNCVDYYHGGDKPYIVSGSDDQEVKVWDYQNKKCIQTLEGHTHNVSVVSFHPTMPFILTGSEDGTLRIYDAVTYRIEKVLNYGLDRIWSISVQKGGNNVAVGYDEGFIVVKLGSEEPAISMDHSGKIVWSKQNEIQQVNLMALPKNTEIVDGERIGVAPKELGSCEIYPKNLEHSPNGRFVCVIGDGEYIIYTALAWRNKSYGSAQHFVWAHDSKRYAIRESSTKIKIFNKFKQERLFEPHFSSDSIYGGFLLGVKSSKSLCFYDWDKCKLIRKIDVVPKAVYWSETGEMLTIVGESSFFILKYNKGEGQRYLESEENSDSGCDIAFDALQEINEKVTKGIWVGDCFVYTNSTNKLNYCIGEEVVTVAHLDKKMYLLGYIAKSNKLFLSDKTRNIFSFTLHVSIVNYQTAVLRGDIEGAQKILPQIPKEMLNRIAQFLDAQGYKELALEVATDLDHKFELAMTLKKFEIAFEIAQKEQSEYKWKQLGDMAISLSDFPLAEKCLLYGGDINALFLIYIISGNVEGIERLSKMAMEKGKNNIAFVSLFLQRKVYECVDLLCSTGRIPEAAFFARCYAPSKVPYVLKLWKSQFSVVNPKAAQSLADPLEYPNLFPNFHLALKAEKHVISSLYSSSLPSSSFSQTYLDNSYLKTDLISLAEQLEDDFSNDNNDDNNNSNNNNDKDDEDENSKKAPLSNNNPNNNNKNTSNNSEKVEIKEKPSTPSSNPENNKVIENKPTTPNPVIPVKHIDTVNDNSPLLQHPSQPPKETPKEIPPQKENTPTTTKVESSPQIKEPPQQKEIKKEATPTTVKHESPPQKKETPPTITPTTTNTEDKNLEDVMKDIENFSSDEEGGQGTTGDENLDWPEDFEDEN